LSTNASSRNVSAGDSFWVAVQYDATTGSTPASVYGTQLTIEFDSEYLNATDVRLGPYLQQNDTNVIAVANDTDNRVGTVEIGLTRVDTTTGATGAGDVAYVRFTTTRPVASAEQSTRLLNFSNVKISNPNSTAIPTETRNGSVDVNTRPTAAFSVPTSVQIDEPVTLNASAATDADGTIEAYRWDLNDDGVYNDTTGEVVDYTFTETGEQNVSLRVVDDDGATDTTTQAVTIGRQAVELNLTANRTRIRLGTTVRFNVTRQDTSKRVNATVTVAGNTTVTGEDGSVAVTPTTTGELVATADKSDRESVEFQNDSLVIRVVSNLKPNPSFGYQPLTPDVNESVTFNASSSADSDGSIRKYQWDLDSDGEFDDASGEVVRYEYTNAGTYQVRLSVTDDSGGTAVMQRNLTVFEKGTVLEVVPETARGQVSESLNYSVRITDADGGVGSYGITVSLTNASVANISGVTDQTGAADVSKRFAANNSSVTISGFLSDTNDTGEVTLSTVTVTGTDPGTTELNVSVSNAGLGDESGSTEYTVTDLENATLTVVAGPPPLEGITERPTDPDADGVYEDVNGDGAVRGSDAVALFRAIVAGDEAVQSYPAAFDLNNDGLARGSDAVALFRAIVRGTEPGGS
jgi:PKD repeat protein